MRPLLRIVFALGIVAGLGGARQACAQSAYGYSGLQFGGASQSLYSYSMTDLDYVAQAYYGVLTDAYLYAGNNIVASSEGATNGGYVDLYYSTSINTSYWIQTNHWIYPIAGGSGMPNFSCVTPAWYQGSFGVSACGTGSSGTTYIGTSYASGDTYGSGPSISGLDETSYGTAQTGTSGYLIIYGSSLTNVDYGSTAVLIDGVTASLTYVNPYQLNVYYTIPGGAAAGGHTLTVTTPYGYTTATFQVYPISITTPSLSGGIEGFPFQQQLWASGGQPPYTWSMAPGSSLPAGLTLTAANGFLGGTPTTPGNAFSFTVQVTDSLGRAATQAYTIAIQGFTLGTVAPGVTGVAGGYTVTVPIPITWTLNFNYAAFQAAGGYLFGDCGTGGPEVALSYSFGGLYAVFNTGLYSGSFPCSVGLAIGALEIFVHIPFNVQPQALINQVTQSGTQTISAGPQQTVIVGQQIVLQGVVLGESFTSPAWTISGAQYVGGGINQSPTVTTSGTPATVNTNAQDVTFYFTTAGNVTVTFAVTGSDGATLYASATFLVVAPNQSQILQLSTATPLGFAGVTIDSNSDLGPGKLAVHYGATAATPGMTFNSIYSMPAGYTGTAEWIQVVNSVSISRFTPGGGGGTIRQCGASLLDAGSPPAFPYSYQSPTKDAPAVQLTVGGSEYTVNETFTMWLMFTPTSVGNAIYVPLVSVPWSWSADVVSTDEGNSWNFKVQPTVSPAQATNGQSTSTFPYWTGSC